MILPPIQFNINKRKDRRVVVIVDLKTPGYPSVTNAIEEVCAHIKGNRNIGYDQALWVYQDSGGVWDGYDPITKKFVFLGMDFWEDAVDKYIFKLNKEEENARSENHRSGWTRF